MRNWSLCECPGIDVDTDAIETVLVGAAGGMFDAIVASVIVVVTEEAEEVDGG
jgi:hypothetical protein